MQKPAGARCFCSAIRRTLVRSSARYFHSRLPLYTCTKDFCAAKFTVMTLILR